MRITAKRLASHIPRQESYIVASKRTPFGAYGGKWVALSGINYGNILTVALCV